jgi:glycosyltransferase involved in cell wall biosynthesis
MPNALISPPSIGSTTEFQAPSDSSVGMRTFPVIQVITRLNVGGPAQHAVDLTLGLSERFPSTLAFGDVDTGEAEIATDVSAGVLPLKRVPGLGRRIKPLDDIRAFIKLYRLLRSERPLLVHTHTAKAGMVGRLAAVAARVPIRVHTFHGHVFRGYFGPWTTRLFLTMERLLARGTSCVIVLSETQKREITEEFRVCDAKRVRVVPLGLALARFAPARIAPLRPEFRREINAGDCTVITIVGRLVPIKDQTLFLQTARDLLTAGRRCLFVIVGGGSEEARLMRLAEHLGVRDHVRFLGWRTDLERIYAGSDIVVLTSANEGTPVCLIEALAAGKPVVATDVGGVRDVLENGRLGVLVQKREPAVLASAIMSLVDDTARCHELSRNGAEAAPLRWDVNRLLKDTASLYDELFRELSPSVSSRHHASQSLPRFSRVGPRQPVVRVITRLNVGGPSQHAVHLTAGLRERFPTMLAFGDVDKGEVEVATDISDGALPLQRVPGLGRRIRPLDDIRAFIKLYLLLRSERPLLVHTHTAKAGMVGRLAAVAARVPIRVHTFHGHVFRGYFGPWTTRLFLTIERLLARGTSCVIVLSENQKREITEEFRVCDAKRVRVVPLGLTLDRFAPARIAPLRPEFRREINAGDCTVITIVGRLVPIKDQALFLQTARELVNAGRRCVFVIVGGGSEESRLSRLAEQLGLGDRVRFLGWRTDLERIYAGSDIVVLTSANEGTPVCLIEALAAGKPVVATDVGGVRDVLENGRLGMLVQKREPAVLASAIMSLMDDTARCDELSRNGAEAAPLRWDVNRLLKDTASLYDELFRDLLPTNVAKN